MSERYGHSKGKINKNYDGTSKSKTNTKSQKEKMESTTPPHPPLRRTSIDELIKKRESLKQELQNIVKHSDSDLNKKYSTKFDKNFKHSKNNYALSDSQSRKRGNTDKETSNTTKKKHGIRDYSPEHTGDFAQMDSEDEETIIEKSRQRRKQLLETLSVSKEKLSDVNKLSNNNIVNKEEHLNTHKSEVKTCNKDKLSTDMFSETDDFTKTGPEKVIQDDTDENNSQLNDNWDDAEGYYNIRIGDKIEKQRYTIKSILGRGVFSNVIRAHDSKDGTDVAIKIIRNHDVTHRTGIKEIDILKEIKEADPENKYHCIRLFRHFVHRNHLCMVMESLYMDLRHVIKKYGHHHGLNMKAIISYSRQLLIALRLLKKIGIVHADIKPDNILINEKKNILKLCDFGSASKVDTNEATPYLVSRFYRAPEIILGVPFKHSVDIWSAACTIFEIATGRIMFPGSSNNKMLKCFMDLKGRFSAKLLKKGRFKDQHFNYKNNFLLHKRDEYTGREKYVEVTHVPITRDLLKDLKKYSKITTEYEEYKLVHIKDLLEKMLMLDPSHRYSVTECLKHPCIREEVGKQLCM